jgi:hypothetical protein
MKYCRHFFCKRRKNIGIYSLTLENNKYYVGQSDDIERRIWMHQNCNGSAWTKKYNVIQRNKLITNDQMYFTELVETLEMMKTYGIQNVRGSMFTSSFKLTKKDTVFAAQLYCELHNLCRKCGGQGHFINQCNHDIQPWVHQFGGSLDMNTNDKRECLSCQCDISSLPSNYRYCRPCFKKINNY